MKRLTSVILVAVLLLLGSCGPRKEGPSNAAAERMKRLPRDLSAAEAGSPPYRYIWVTSYHLDPSRRRGPGVTLILSSVTAENTSRKAVEPVCWLWYGSQLRLLDAEETPVIPPGDEARMQGTVHFPDPLDANESEMIVCRDKRDNELAPEDH